MKKYILPIFIFFLVGTIFQINNQTKISKENGRTIASSPDLDEQFGFNSDDSDETNSTTSSAYQGNDCVECRLAQLEVELAEKRFTELLNLVQVYSSNQQTLSQLGNSSAQDNSQSVVGQMSDFTDQFFATNPLVTGTLGQFTYNNSQTGNNNSLTLSGYSSGYGFDYNSYLGISGTSVESNQMPVSLMTQENALANSGYTFLDTTNETAGYNFSNPFQKTNVQAALESTLFTTSSVSNETSVNDVGTISNTTYTFDPSTINSLDAASTDEIENTITAAGRS